MKTKRLSGKTVILSLAMLFSLAALFLMIYSVAAYSDISKSKKVVSTSETQVFFSARYLELYQINAEDPTGIPPVTISTRGILSTAITNHILGNTHQVNDDDITYTLSLKILGIEPTEGNTDDLDHNLYAATFKGETIYFDYRGYAKSTPSSTLRGGTSHEDRVEFSANLPDNTKVSIKATPTDGGATSNRMLYGDLIKLYTGGEGTQLLTNWTGTIVGESSMQEPIEDYAAFLYQLTRSGSAVDGTIRISWDSDVVELEASPVALAGLSPQPQIMDGEGTMKYIVIPTNINSPEMYKLRFFRADNFNTISTKMITYVENVNDYITCIYSNTQNP